VDRSIAADDGERISARSEFGGETLSVAARGGDANRDLDSQRGERGTKSVSAPSGRSSSREGIDDDAEIHRDGSVEYQDGVKIIVHGRPRRQARVPRA
jgi:hypothetical protein